MSEAAAIAPAATASAAPPESTNPDEATEEEVSSKEVAESSRMVSPDLLVRQMAHCGEYTFQALNKIGKLSPVDTSKVTQRYLKKLHAATPGEPLPDALIYLVREGWKKDEIEARDVVLKLTKAMIRYSKSKITHVPFAHQNETPIDFYNAFPQISEIARILSSPVIQASEKDFVMVTSINPFTATAAARLISNEVQKEVGRKPFHFITTTDLNAWKYTRDRHFGT